MKRYRSSLVLILLPLLVLCGCDSDRLAQFGAFAAAGSAYVTSFHTFTADAGTAFIAADSSTLIAARNQAGNQVASNASFYRKAVAEQDVQLTNYLSNLQKLDDHAALLGQYFAAITQLTNGKASASTVTTLDSLVDSINQFNPEIEQATFAGKNVKDYLSSATTLVIAHFEVRALNKQLQQNAAVIDHALLLQEAAVAAISAQMRDSNAASLAVREETYVLDPYVATGGLPNNWPSARESFVRTNVLLTTSDAAKTAVTALHDAYRNLISNRRATIDFGTLMSAIGKMAGYAAAEQSSLK